MNWKAVQRINAARARRKQRGKASGETARYNAARYERGPSSLALNEGDLLRDPVTGYLWREIIDRDADGTIILRHFERV